MRLRNEHGRRRPPTDAGEEAKGGCWILLGILIGLAVMAVWVLTAGWLGLRLFLSLFGE